MSLPLYEFGGLRFWSEPEIETREAFQLVMSQAVRRTLLGMNPAWRFARCETPPLVPESVISKAYDGLDVFCTDDVRGGQRLCLRPETTHGSYTHARHMGGKLPLCVWQAGQSFRRETNDGASGAKLRFNAFWQLEFQCIYRADTKADYRPSVLDAACHLIERATGLETRVVDSDRLPAYSESTLDIEALWRGGWKEVASCSIRTDYSVETRVLELAIGLCRIAEMAGAAE